MAIVQTLRGDWMSEKRFILMLPNAIINDTIVRKSYYLSEKDDVEKLVGVLNEQQATINNQEQKIKILQQEINDTQAILEMLTEKLKGWNDE